MGVSWTVGVVMLLNRHSGMSLGRRGLAALLGVALAVTLVGCSSSTKKQPPAETLRMGVLEAIDNLPYFVMVEKGFAAREGLRFEETVVAGGTAALAALAEGTLDVGGVGVTSLLAGARKGVVPTKAVGILASGFATPQKAFIGVVASSEVRGWGDLAGRPVAVNAKLSLGAAGLAGRLSAERVGPAKVVELPFPNMGLAIRAGDVAAAVMIEPYLTQSLLRGDGHLLGWVLGGVPMERAEFGVWAVNTELVRTRPEVVKSYIRAHLEAVAWIIANEAAARELLARRLSLSSEVAKQVQLPLWAPDGRNDPTQIAVIADLVTRLQGGTAVAPTQFYDETLLDAVLKER